MTSANSIEHKLKFSAESLSKAGKQIASYIENHIDHVSSMSILELAQKIGTSEASINRFCKALGFKGYRDFIISLSKELGSKKEAGPTLKYTDIKPGDDINIIIENVSLVNMQSIADTKTIIDPVCIKKAVEIIRNADRLFFFGIGASGLVALDGQQKFMRIKMMQRYSYLIQALQKR